MTEIYRRYSIAKYQTFSVSMSQEMVSEVKEFAINRKSNISVITRTAVRQYLDREKEKDRDARRNQV